MKNILFVDHHAELGGGEIALLEIIKNINKSNFSCLVCLGDNGPLEDEFKKIGIEVIILKLPDFLKQLNRDPETPNRLSAFIKSAICLPVFIKKLKSIIIEKNIDIVYTNSIKSALYAVIAAKQTKCKVIWHLHDCLTSEFYPSWIIKLIIALMHKADKIICVSNIVKEYFLQAGGETKKAMVIYNGVDTERFKPDINSDLKKELNIADKKIISIVGRLEPWKGQHIFIDTAGIICKKRNDIIFLIAGSPIFGFYDYEKQLKKMVHQLGLRNKVLFLGFRHDIEQIYAASDIIVHCSTRPEPFGRDIIEAFACAKPVISFASGAAKEIITSQTGILVEPINNAQALADNIILLLENHEQRRTLGINARKTAKAIFSIEKIVNDIEKIL